MVNLRLDVMKIVIICSLLFLGMGCQSTAVAPVNSKSEVSALSHDAARQDQRQAIMPKPMIAKEPKPGQYVEVKEASQITFTATAKMLGVSSEVTGAFTDFSIMAIQHADQNKVSVEVIIAANSIDTDNARRDRHLRNEDFFDVKKFGSITFKSKRIRQLKEGLFEIHGGLTVKNKLTNITFQVAVEPATKLANAWRVQGNTKFNRHELGITYKSPLYLPDVGDEILVKFDMVLRLKP